MEPQGLLVVTGIVGIPAHVVVERSQPPHGVLIAGRLGVLHGLLVPRPSLVAALDDRHHVGCIYSQIVVGKSPTEVPGFREEGTRLLGPTTGVERSPALEEEPQPRDPGLVGDGTLDLVEKLMGILEPRLETKGASNLGLHLQPLVEAELWSVENRPKAPFGLDRIVEVPDVADAWKAGHAQIVREEYEAQAAEPGAWSPV